MTSPELQALIEDMRRWSTLPERLRYWASVRCNRPFVTVGAETLTFGELDRLSDALAAGLAGEGVVKGDRVAIIMKNRVEFIVSFFALAKLGAVATPINIYLRGNFLAHQLRDCDASVVIADAAGAIAIRLLFGELPHLREIVCVDPVDDHNETVIHKSYTAFLERDPTLPKVAIERHDLMSILYTSGTTGLPKGCMLTHGYYMAVPRHYFESGWCGTDDTVYTAYPLYHASGNLITLMNALQGGLHVVYAPEFSARRFMAEAGACGATIAFGVGPMGAAILASPEGDSDRAHELRLAFWVPMKPELQERFEARFGVAVVGEGYGQTERTPISLSRVGEERTKGSCGLPVNSLEVRILNDQDEEVERGVVGEIAIRPLAPDAMFSGYWRQPDATLEAFRNFWHHTGDFGTMNARGELFYVDRKKDALRRRGVNISSVELEHAIAKHPQVESVAVHAVPSPLGDDDIKACIVLTEGANLTPEALFNFFKETLPYYAIPRYVELPTTLPVNAMGRIMKHELRKQGIGNAWDFEVLGFAVARNDRR